MSAIKIGVVGLSAEGWAGMALVNPLLAPPLSSMYTLTALSTRSSESASVSANKYSELTKQSVKPFHGDTSQIANHEGVDLVAVAVKAPSHKQAAMPVIEAGKNLFLEWPCGNGLQEAKELLEAAKRKGVRTMAGLQGRQSPVLRKVKELVSSGKIGRVLSTTVVLNVPKEFAMWGPVVSERSLYTADGNSGGTMLKITVGHFIGNSMPILGDLSCVTATARTQHPTVTVVDGAGNPTGQTLQQTGADQVAFSGVLKSGAVMSLHCRSGQPITPGRTSFIWIIDGEEGSIKLQSDHPGGSFIQVRPPTVYLNGEEVKFDEEDTLGNIGRAWLEFAKGAEGDYPSLEDAVKIHRVLDAIETSAKEGKRIDVS